MALLEALIQFHPNILKYYHDEKRIINRIVCQASAHGKMCVAEVSIPKAM
jgi:hypothetical protein